MAIHILKDKIFKIPKAYIETPFFRHTSIKKQEDIMTPRNVPAKDDDDIDVKDTPASPNKESETAKLNRLLGAVMRYLSDDEQEEIDIEYLLENTEGLRDWWSEYRELDRKRVEEEIKNSLTNLSLEELENIREQIRTKE
jgi:hypothetical protein